MIDYNKNPFNVNAPFEKLSTIDTDKKVTIPDRQNLSSTLPVPILVLYLDISEVENMSEILEQATKEMTHFRKFGWEFIIIPTKLSTKLECISVNNIDLIEFEKFKIEILSKWIN